MDINSSDQNGKPSINPPSAEDPKEAKEEKNALPTMIRPKFSNRRKGKRRRLQKKNASKETLSKDFDETIGQENVIGGEKISDDKEENEKLSLERASMEKASKEKASAEKVEQEDVKDTRDFTKEAEEPECRTSETNIVVNVEQQNSPTDIRNLPTPTVILLEDKSDEKQKKKKDSLDENGEKKKNGSKRKTKGKKKKTSGRNPGSNRKQQTSDDRKKKKKLPNQKENLSKESNPSPRQSVCVPLKVEKSAEILAAAKKSKANNKTSDSTAKTPSVDKKGPQAPQQQGKKKTGFFKNILDKTKFWMRKSDDVAQPTKEMLFKSYVSPEYGHYNSSGIQPDFIPDPSQAFVKEVEECIKQNHKTGSNDIFVNNRPYWVHRTNEDVIPKCKLLSYSGLISQHNQNNQYFLKELPKRTFYDPKTDALEKLQAIDKAIGVDKYDLGKEKELRRVTSNTFFSTLQIHAYKNTLEGKRKIEDAETRYNKELAAAAEDKKSQFGQKIVFTHVQAPSTEKKDVDKTQPIGPVLFSYNRKARPEFEKSRPFKSNGYVIHDQLKKPSKHKDVQVTPITNQESQHVQKI